MQPPDSGKEISLGELPEQFARMIANHPCQGVTLTFVKREHDTFDRL